MRFMTQEERWLLEAYGGKKTSGFFAAFKRLQQGEPLAYIIGSIPFLNTTIYLDSRPLIPRAETEYWVSLAVDDIRQSGIQAPKVLDLCAGSGCIGVAVAHHIPQAMVHFAEIDRIHHDTIRKNIRSNGIDESHTDVMGGNLFEAALPPYDYILSNPPYIPEGSERVAQSVRDHEPKLALYGGKNGTDIIARILTHTPHYLAATGTLFIEHEPEQSAAIAILARKNGLVAVTHSDQYGVSRYSTVAVAQ